MSGDRLVITPQTKIGDLLKAYPELQETLIAIAPAFKKLRNPVLLRTVARVTSLAQAARVGGVSVAELVGRLRQTVGQPELEITSALSAATTDSQTPPAWFDPELISQSHDARPLIESGLQPIGQVLGDLDRLAEGVIYELITPFEPAPLIDRAVEKGFVAWTRAVATGEHRTYFKRP